MEITKEHEYEAYEAMSEYYEEEHRNNTKLAYKNSFKQLLKIKDSSFVEKLLTLKFIICLLFSLFPKESQHGVWYKRDETGIVNISYSDLYAGWESVDGVVGVGIFKNWFYEIRKDGDWNM